jgi:hypothetical protein
MEQKLRAAYNKLDELLEVHKEHPMTTNRYFIDNRKNLQQKNSDEIEERLKSKFTQPGQRLTVHDIAKIVKTITLEVSPDMDLVAAEEAFDNMTAYYEASYTVMKCLILEYQADTN